MKKVLKLQLKKAENQKEHLPLASTFSISCVETCTVK